jgi:putative ABC transport system permease protein
MEWMRILISRAASLFTRRRLDADLDEELRAHVDLSTAEHLKCGLSPSDARAAALREFGGVAQTREAYRLQRGLLFPETLAQDLRFASRQLLRDPGFAATTILTLALGIGANTAIFTIVQSVVLAPLPYRQPDRLVMLSETRPGVKELGISYPDFQDWQRNSRSFERMAALAWRDYDLTGSGPAEHLDGMEVSSGFFATLGLKLPLGREFSAEEDRPGAAPQVILSDRLWKDRFASSPQIIGKTMLLDGVDYTIVGILPPGFRLWTQADVYTPLGEGEPLYFNDRTIHSIVAIARLEPGLSIDQAQRELGGAQTDLDRFYPAADRTLGVSVVPLKRSIVGDAGGTLLLLLGAVGIVLLIAGTNVANLLLARAAARTREFGIRSALGASSARLMRQLLTESVLLALAGGLAGLGLANVGVRAAAATMLGNLPRSENLSLNFPVLVFAFGISLVIGIVFGLAPALRSSRFDLLRALKSGDRGSTRAHPHTQSTLVIVQMALTLVLLAGSGLLLRTLHDLWSVNPGFSTEHVITFKVGLSPSLTKTASSTRTAYRELLDRIRVVPGVEAADFTNIVPLGGNDNGGPFWVGAHQSTSIQDAPHALYFETGPEYLRTMKIPLVLGRFFTSADNSDSEPVVVIDTVLAHSYFPGKDPVGQTITVGHWRAARVIGVVGHVRHWGLGDPGTYNPSQIYICFYQLSDAWIPAFARALSIAVRTQLDVASLMPPVESVIFGAGKDQPVYDIHTMEQVASNSMASQRLSMILLGAFAILALLLASVGIYGVTSYSVNQRIQEIGIRMALGASRRNILRLILRSGLQLTVAGLAIGIAVALMLARILASFSSLLYGVKASDPLTFLTVSLVLTGAAILACFIPARRAMSIDPMHALRNE